MQRSRIILIAAIASAIAAACARAETYEVKAGDDWAALGSKLAAGDEVVLLEGVHHHAQFEGLAGTADKPIVIRSHDKGKLAEIAPDREGLRLTNCRHVRVERVLIKSARRAGVVIDSTGSGVSEDISLHDTLVMGVGGLIEQAGILVIGSDRVDIRRTRMENCVGSGLRIENSNAVTCERVQIRSSGSSATETGILVLGQLNGLEVDDAWIAGKIQTAISLGTKDAPRAPRPPREIPIPTPASIREQPGQQRPPATPEPAKDHPMKDDAPKEPDDATGPLVRNANLMNVLIRDCDRAFDLGSIANSQVSNSSVFNPSEEVFRIATVGGGRPDAELRFRNNIVSWRVGGLRRLVEPVQDATGKPAPTKGLILGPNLWWSNELPSALALLGPSENPFQGTLEVPQTTDIDPDFDSRGRPTREAAKMYGRNVG